MRGCDKEERKQIWLKDYLKKEIGCTKSPLFSMKDEEKKGSEVFETTTR